MGFYKDIHIEILEWRARGRTVEDTYIYFKDYVTHKEVEQIFAGDFDEETV